MEKHENDHVELWPIASAGLDTSQRDGLRASARALAAPCNRGLGLIDLAWGLPEFCWRAVSPKRQKVG